MATPEPHAAPAPVFRLELPLRLAPTMNQIMSLIKRARGRRCYQLDEIKQEIARHVRTAALRYPSGKASGRRRVEVTRHSSRQPDELSADILGAKLVLDALVKAGVLRDDSIKWCERVARWEQAPPGHGRLVVEVFVALDQSADIVSI